MNILLGTSKGLVDVNKIGEQWKIEKVHFLGMPIAMIYVDERTDTWWVSIAHRHWGQKLHYSEDRGESWSEVKVPNYEKREYQKGETAILKKIWCMQHAGTDRPGCLWLGTEPGGLFYSENNGESFSLVEGLWQHPSRIDGNQWWMG